MARITLTAIGVILIAFLCAATVMEPAGLAASQPGHEGLEYAERFPLSSDTIFMVIVYVLSHAAAWGAMNVRLKQLERGQTELQVAQGELWAAHRTMSERIIGQLEARVTRLETIVIPPLSRDGERGVREHA